MFPLAYFVRHGQTDWNREQRLQGQAEKDLNETGRTQAAANGRKLAQLVGDPRDFDFVASPMLRTRHTMEIMRGAMGLEPQGYRTDERLVEVNFGNWQGHTFPELERVHPGAYLERERDKWRFLPPGEDAESYAMLAARIAPWLGNVGGPTICVTHGGVLRGVLHLVGGVSEAEAAAVEVPQDKVLRIEEGRFAWL